MEETDKLIFVALSNML